MSLAKGMIASSKKSQGPQILQGRWTGENRRELENLITTKFNRPPIAVFDWDNTCIRGDIGDVVFHHLSYDLAFRFEAPGFWDWITEARTEDQVSDAYDDYRSDPNQQNRTRLRMSFEITRRALHEGADDTSAWAWDTGAFIGWTEKEAREYSMGVIAAELGRPTSTETIGLDGDSVLISHGLRIFTEMRGLVRAMQDLKWRVCVVSASPQWEVEAFASIIGVHHERVVGMRREIIHDRISHEIAPPISYSDGKLDAYQVFVSGEEPPTFVAGDSAGDWKLLESATHARLLVEPTPTHLRTFALWRKISGETWLLQNFD